MSVIAKASDSKLKTSGTRTRPTEEEMAATMAEKV
jgi:hypothetical protein